MTSTHRYDPSLDEQLGSPGLTLEAGWLTGVFLGFAAVVVLVRRTRRRRRAGRGRPGDPPAARIDLGRAGRAVVVSSAGTSEREVKWDVDTDFVLPDFRDLVGQTTQLGEQELQAAYFDTSDLRLWSRGITLRHRQGEGPPSGTWMLELLVSTPGDALERSELTWPGPRALCPAKSAGSSEASCDTSGWHPSSRSRVGDVGSPYSAIMVHPSGSWMMSWARRCTVAL